MSASTYERLKSLLLIFSLAFNIAFVGIWLHSRRHHRPPAELPPPPSQQAGRDGLEALQLRPEQRRTLDAKRRELARRTEQLETAARAEQERLFELMSADEPNPEAIKEAERRLDEARAEIHRLTVQQMRELREVLDPEQRRVWIGMMRNRAERGGMRRRGPARGRGPESAPPTARPFRERQGGRPGRRPRAMEQQEEQQ